MNNDDEFIDFEFLDKEKQAEQVRLYDETEEGEDGDDDRKEDEDEEGEGENESEPAANQEINNNQTSDSSEYEIPTIQTVIDELNEAKEHSNGLSFGKQVRFNDNIKVNIIPYEYFEQRLIQDETDYNLINGRLFKDLNIEIRSGKIPRYECANHKLNISARKSIRAFKPLVKILRAINNSNVYVKKTIKLSKIFRKKNVVYDLKI